MLATDELFIMLEPMLSEVIVLNEKNTNKMVDFYVNIVVSISKSWVLLVSFKVLFSFIKLCIAFPVFKGALICRFPSIPPVTNRWVLFL